MARAVSAEPPNVVLIMADDLGFSDVGCFGSEIPTPHLDALARHGTVFTNFSNTSRCCPSRASLLTGLYAHQAGVGDMNNSDSGPGYRGQLRSDVLTLPERLRASRYSTMMVGKWHLTRSGSIDDGPNGSWPFERGFDRFFGTMEGAKNYFRPTWLFDQSNEATSFDETFFYTDAIASRASSWIQEQPTNKPFFLYAAFYAPHFPLQAPQESIENHRGRYMAGWDELRRKRLSKQKALGVLPEQTQLTARPSDVPAWHTLSIEQQQELDLRMATYAAQIEKLDQGVGKIVAALRQTERFDNTLVVFLSDNGGASPGGPFGAGPSDRVGTPEAPVKTTYGKGWATLSNTPFRMHKANTHEGGVMSPLIVHWPKRLGAEQVIRDDVAHIVDIAPTVISAAGHDESSQVFSGIDLFATRRAAETPVFYEHQKSRAVRAGTWKLVNRGKSNQWELYDLATDRTEQKDLAKREPVQLKRLKELWLDWARRNHVKTK
ncbi:MAG: arylsulfatase [Planctomycetota bacterium]